MKPILLLFINILFLQTFLVGQDSLVSQLNPVIVTANKTSEKRIESPIAISLVSKESIALYKPNRIDYLLNKVSGVYMPSIGNEQHMMAIRQPISLKGLYLYLEDGMPIRTSGLFSNNALIEINTATIQSIEIIKGPASALYGAEAIGGVINIVSPTTPKKNVLHISNQANSNGFIKTDLTYGFPTQSGGWLFNVNYGVQNEGPIEYSNYSKKVGSIKHDFKLNKWNGFQTIQLINYFAQMTGSLDSTHFFSHNFSALQTFTFRKINAFRFRQSLNYNWNEHATTSFNFMFRNNLMDQNPTYSIANTSNPTKFKGQTNSNTFDAFVIDIQHLVNLKSLNSKFMLGVTTDFTKQLFKAHFIDIFKDTFLGKYTNFSYPLKDSLLSNYQSKINNQAIYVNFISSIGNSIRTNLALRYDHFEYQFFNYINMGTPNSQTHFEAIIPKLGVTYNKNNFGGYVNFSEGFVPPQITEIYNAIRVPYLLPQTFQNKELGIWYHRQKWSTEIALYQLLGNNEIISVRQPDGVNLNQNAGSTQHIGIEYQLNYHATKWLSIIGNATNAKHTYLNTIIKNVDVSGKEINAAPHFWSNVSCNFYIKTALNCSIEWQHQSNYFMDEVNTTSYAGFDVVNFRMNYKIKKHEFWIHLLNATNSYYSTMATKNFSLKGNAAYSYYLGEPRSIAFGWKWSIVGPQ